MVVLLGDVDLGGCLRGDGVCGTILQALGIRPGVAVRDLLAVEIALVMREALSLVIT